MKVDGLALTVVALALATLQIEMTAAGPRKLPPDVPGTFAMSTACGPSADGPDRITGDCAGSYQADSDGTYVILNGNRELRAVLYGARFVYLDFSQPIAGTQCQSGCFRQFGDIVIPQPNLYPPEGPARVVMQTNVVDAAGNDLANGLFGIPVGNTLDARFFVSFYDPNGRDFHWSALFNPREYAGSHYVTATRTAPCTWTIAGAPGTRAGLRAWAVKKGKDNNSNEGLFEMPFALHFTAPNCGA